MIIHNGINDKNYIQPGYFKLECFKTENKLWLNSHLNIGERKIYQQKNKIGGSKCLIVYLRYKLKNGKS